MGLDGNQNPQANTSDDLSRDPIIMNWDSSVDVYLRYRAVSGTTSVRSEKAGLGRKEFQVLLASNTVSNDLSWCQDMWNWDVPAELVQICYASHLWGGGVVSGKEVTSGWGNSQGRDSAMTCQQATFATDTEINVFILKEKPRQFTTAPTIVQRHETCRGV